MGSVRRIYVEKKQPYAVHAKELKEEVKRYLGIKSINNVRVLIRYDVENLSDATYKQALGTVFSEPPVDNCYENEFKKADGSFVFSVEYLPGQFDQRANSAAECIQIISKQERPLIKTAKVYVLYGNLSREDVEEIKKYLINPVESREASLDAFDTLDVKYEIPTEVATVEGFCEMDEAALAAYIKDMGLAMDLDDIKVCQKYFLSEQRDPTITEIKMIDTYWSDHCRHTTFQTTIDSIKFEDATLQAAYNEYLATREAIGRTKPINLMDMGTIVAKFLKKEGKLDKLDESEEINACTVKIDVDVEGKTEKWLLLFKNETHNHPTEIEPFGGAATCVGGAIRDPLSGRSYVYAAMRVTGAGNPLTPVSETLRGKLPQRKITVGAANGYSSYGNQIGLATGHVAEVYHPGYMAKRMEIGAVLGAAPASNIRREAPVPGDIVILLGGKTGRDGCGGATGSSKSHTVESLGHCGAEVQKGNAPEERKLQRLFRNPTVTQMIKRCNDFGAGGVSVAIGELTDGLEIDLNAVPKKYDGLDGTEIAISESQERMAVVVAAEDADKFIKEAGKENLEATIVATVQAEPRLRMHWNGNTIVDLSREFLNSNGAVKHTDIAIEAPQPAAESTLTDSADAWTELLSSLNICSQKGLIEKFDSTIGAGTVLMPFGGVYQLSPSQAMAAKIPVLKGETNTCSLMGWGYNPTVSERNPYLGAMDAVITSIAKVVAAGGSWHHCWLTFQEYFERTQNDPKRWGKPMAALLGAFKAQLELSCGSIGGKDSMSGTFENIDVPPTLVSFAVSTAKADKVVSTEFKQAGDKVVMLRPETDENGIPSFESVRATFDKVEAMIAAGRIRAGWVIDYGGVAEGIAKMCFGNGIGFTFDRQLTDAELFQPCCGGFLLELCGDAEDGEDVIGSTSEKPEIVCPKFTLQLDKLLNVWEKKLEPVFPCRIKTTTEVPEKLSYPRKTTLSASVKSAQPRVLIPVFPGTNCEYDTARVFERAGARPQTFIVRNLSAAAMEDSITTFAAMVRQAQIIMIPGGFSGGDEPEGSGKFITAFFRNPRIKDAVHDLLKNRDGLMLGICNGFQALVKLGLVPFGEIMDMTDVSPTLTFNTIARHQSMLVRTRIASNKSPWLYGTEVDDVHTVAISHGEGRFVAPPELLADMAKNGQIATQYVDMDGNPTMDIHFNPNTSMMAIEGITSPDGRVLGKMGHSERIGQNLYQNVPGEKDQKIFESGVAYFK